MKKLLSTLLVAMLTMVIVTAMAIEPPVVVPMSESFTIKNITSQKGTEVLVKDFTSNGNNEYTYEVDFSELVVCCGDKMEIIYNPTLSMFTPQLTWSYCMVGLASHDAGTGLTTNFSVPSPYIDGRTLIVTCDYQGYQGSSQKRYIINFPDVRHRGNQITVKNSNASEVQVSYENYGEVLSAGQRASVALYDIYGNPVSTGYLDALGMGTLSTKGKPGIYIVKVIMNNQVIFNQRIQVK